MIVRISFSFFLIVKKPILLFLEFCNYECECTSPVFILGLPLHNQCKDIHLLGTYLLNLELRVGSEMEEVFK